MSSKRNLVYGIHPVLEALNSGKNLDKVLVKSGILPGTENLLKQLRLSGVPIQFVPAEKLNKITSGNHQGVIAFISEIEYYKLDEIIPFTFEQGKVPFVLVIDGITDVRNFGAIARTAECAGVDAIVLPSKGSVAINADAIKTSAGALHKIPVCKTNNLTESLNYLRNSGLMLVGATEKSASVYYKTDFTVPLALILGAEDTGLSQKVIKMADFLIKIPMFGTIKSLNVSVAASILLYEAVRQRNFQE